MGANRLGEKKMTGEERRAYIIHLLKNSKEPIRGKTLAEKTNVSRQVIVTDIALLKTGDEPIIGTNRGYLYIQDETSTKLHRRVIVCNHTPEQTKLELKTIVDFGVSIIDVIVEHPYYGDLTGSLMISSRFDVEQFINVISTQEASLLSVLTGGVHLHTIEADSIEKLDGACEALQKLGILLTENT